MSSRFLASLVAIGGAFAVAPGAGTCGGPGAPEVPGIDNGGEDSNLGEISGVGKNAGRSPGPAG